VIIAEFAALGENPMESPGDVFESMIEWDFTWESIAYLVVGYIQVILITTLFANDYNNMIVEACWMFRSFAWLSWHAFLASIIVLLAVFLLCLLLNTRQNIIVLTAAIIFEQLFIACAPLFLVILIAQGLYCYWCGFIKFSLAHPDSWVPSFLFWPLIVGPLALFSLWPTWISVKIALPLLRLPLASAAVIQAVIAPYLPWVTWANRLRFDLGRAAVEFHGREDDTDPANVVLLISDSHIAAPGQGVIGSAVPSEETVGVIQHMLEDIDHDLSRTAECF
jgi:hypothetical protein